MAEPKGKPNAGPKQVIIYVQGKGATLKSNTQGVKVVQGPPK